MVTMAVEILQTVDQAKPQKSSEDVLSRDISFAKSFQASTAILPEEGKTKPNVVGEKSSARATEAPALTGIDSWKPEAGKSLTAKESLSAPEELLSVKQWYRAKTTSSGRNKTASNDAHKGTVEICGDSAAPAIGLEKNSNPNVNVEKASTPATDVSALKGIDPRKPLAAKSLTASKSLRASEELQSVKQRHQPKTILSDRNKAASKDVQSGTAEISGDSAAPATANVVSGQLVIPATGVSVSPPPSNGLEKNSKGDKDVSDPRKAKGLVATAIAPGKQRPDENATRVAIAADVRVAKAGAAVVAQSPANKTDLGVRMSEGANGSAAHLKTEGAAGVTIATPSVVQIPRDGVATDHRPHPGNIASGSGTVGVASNDGASASVPPLLKGYEAGDGALQGVLSVSPKALEVGMANGPHGWLKIRAEIDDGVVTASLATHSVAAQEVLHRELPGLTTYLQQESVAVHAVVINKLGNGEVMTGQSGTEKQNGNGATPAQGDSRNEQSSEYVQDSGWSVGEESGSNTGLTSDGGGADWYAWRYWRLAQRESVTNVVTYNFF